MSQVSIVICAWNNWPDLEMAIQSALQQSLPPLEVIVVDNSSADETPRQMARLFGSRVRYFLQPNRDCAGAYNTGYRESRGEFVQFMDGDDVLAPNKLAKQVEFLRAHEDIDLVYGDIRHFQLSDAAANWNDIPTHSEQDMLLALLAPEKEGAGINALGTLFRRRCFDKSGPWDESMYCEDTEYWLRAAWRGCRFGRCEGVPLGFKRVRPGQKVADVAAVDQGFEAALAKALEYVDRDPYRALILEKLAQKRFHTAVSRSDCSAADALRKLALARTTDMKTVSRGAYLIGLVAILVPGGRFLVRSRGLQWLRRRAARLMGYPLHEHPQPT